MVHGPISEGYCSAADGYQLFYRKVGDHPHVAVYLHGGPGLDMHDGGYDIEPLAVGRTLLLYDQRGGGRSHPVHDETQLTADQHVEDLEALRQHFALEHMDLIGNSWGCLLAVLYASRYPERVNRLLLLVPGPVAKAYRDQRVTHINALIGPDGLARVRELGQLIAAAAEADVPCLSREYAEILARPYLVDATSLSRFRGDFGAMFGRALRQPVAAGPATMRSLHDRDLRPVLATLPMPALVVEGADTTIPLDGPRAWAMALPNSRLLLLPRLNHLWMERVDDVVPPADQFLRGEWPKDAEMVTS